MKCKFLFAFILGWSLAVSVGAESKRENKCEKALQENTEFRVKGIYGSPLENEWHPAAAYVLIKEMQRFQVLKKEFVQTKADWRFEFVEMIGGKTIVFVYHLKTQVYFCNGPNAFFVVPK